VGGKRQPQESASEETKMIEERESGPAVTNAACGLTPEQLDQFQRDGYLVLPAVFSEDEIRRMRAEADRILELILNSSVALGRRSGRLDWRELADGTQIVRKIQPINDLSDYLAQVSNDPRLIQPMRQIMGHEPVLMEEKLNYKQPLPQRVEGVEIRPTDDRFPVHNDWAYYRAQSYPQDILSSAISMDDSTVESGPLHVWPGSHREHLEHDSVSLGLQVKPGLIDYEGGVDILAPAGSVMIFHALLVHNARPNTSGRPRRIMIYSHYPDRVDMGHDVRNGPTRVREQPYEQKYREKVARKAYTPTFSAPR
jgi:ectoine hydroxylase-related dioxygenase (phytanoyl-CoA dioxygenase family)